MADTSLERERGETGKTHELQQAPERRTLWILVSREDGSSIDTVVPLYATGEEDAHQRARRWLDVHPPTQCISLRSFPGGFVMGLTQLQGILAE